MEMEMEMEMRCKDQDIEIATDITPPLTPLSFSLHNTNLHTHCSSCFSLITTPIPNSIPPLYCSPHCTAAHSSIHLSSAEHHLPPSTTSSLLRTALRLLLISHHHTPPSPRLNRLLTNRHLLTCHNDEISETIRINALAMATAIAKQRSGGGLIESSDEGTVLEEATLALCAVLTNAVEVHDNEGCALGIAVFEPAFSWINHSCSPNACYRFSFESSSLLSQESELRIAPFTHDSQQPKMDCRIFGRSGKNVCGPRLIVRSIKRIKMGEEVTVAYTDLLQPKALRQSELWSKYRFICCCKRCSSLPFTYVDHSLQEISVSCRDSSGLRSDYKLFRDMADRRLTDNIEDVISEYLSVGDSASCCEKLEKILIQGLDEELETNEGKSHSKLTLHPLHHLSLNSYTTLTSAYKVRASDLLSDDSETDLNQTEAFDMSRTSAAYSLFLAGATHHLFNSESSLIASVANFWIGAGESLLTLTTSSGWSRVVNFNTKFECSKCSLMNRFRASMLNGQIRSEDFEIVSNEFIHCVSDITHKVWSFLAHGCDFLKSCKDPINFSWLMSTENSEDVAAHDIENDNESGNSVGVCDDQAYNNQRVAYIFQLGGHCLTYGGLLACICYGPHSHLVSHVQNILAHENDSLFSQSFGDMYDSL
ncbi:protein SET DOMAIN GROUP 41 isoform X2 [Vicia villosa]|uniref:protein SET DOMAIN GROUP 41 isoform X2 n=1 Tax=Vicia villosa TaxID=3911 RepID=UPI00273A8361|nr:protein SET DOMAIN GROUP 41 isoform X2 [Vicia villosa]